MKVLWRNAGRSQSVGHFWAQLIFIKTQWMHHTSHHDPLLPLYCSTRYSQLPLITRGWTEHQFGCHSMSSSSRKWQYERAFHRNGEMEPLLASDETIPFSPNQLVNLGHHLKDEQLRRPQSDKMVRKGCYVSVRWSGTTSFFFQFSRDSVNSGSKKSVFQSRN